MVVAKSAIGRWIADVEPVDSAEDGLRKLIAMGVTAAEVLSTSELLIPSELVFFDPAKKIVKEQPIADQVFEFEYEVYQVFKLEFTDATSLKESIFEKISEMSAKCDPTNLEFHIRGYGRILTDNVQSELLKNVMLIGCSAPDYTMFIETCCDAWLPYSLFGAQPQPEIYQFVFFQF